MSEIKVNSIKGVGASAAAITVNNTDGSCTANITNNLSNRNLIINGAMQVAQRGTSSTTSGYGTVDRFTNTHNGTDEAPTQAQVEVVSSDSGDNPFAKGFSNCMKITNGNQTSGAGAGDWVNIGYKPEAQDIRNSGWNYNSSSSYITLSFYAKASVAQTYQVRLSSKDGTSQGFVFEYALSANTWTKITKTIPGNSSLQFDNNNGNGMEMEFLMFIGTTYTSASPTLDAWGTYNYTTSRKDMTSTWYTTNDATFELTGVQLEVGSVATDFEHRSFGQELALCQRYYQKFVDAVTGANKIAIGCQYTSSQLYGFIRFLCEMRAAPTIDQGSASGNNYAAFSAAYPNGVNFNSFNGFTGETTRGTGIYVNGVSGTAGQSVIIDVINSAGGYIAASSEL